MGSGMWACPSLADSISVRSFDVSKYDKILVPKGHGEILSMRDGHRGRYPSRYQSMQFIAFFNSHQGLYIQTKDPEAHIMDWIVTKSGELRILFHGPEVEVVIKTIEPKVERAASLYKDWARRQFWAKKKATIMDDVSYIAMAASNNITNMRRITPLILDRYSSPTACWITKYRRHPFEKMFPDYEPGDPQAVRRFLSELHERSCVPLPYINGCLIDEGMLNEDNRNSLLIDSAGKTPYYNKKLSFLKYACPSTTYWLSTILGARKRLVDTSRSVSAGVYYDMIAATEPHLCYATNHNHKPADARTWVSSFRSLLTDTPGVIMAEGNAEVYIDLTDVFLMHFHTEKDNVVPLWNYVYGDISNVAGWNMKLGGTPDEFSESLSKAKNLGANYYGSPWMKSRLQTDLMEWERQGTKVNDILRMNSNN